MSGNETRDEFPYDEYSAPRRRVMQWLRRIPLARGIGVIVALFLLYYSVGAAVINKIDADPDFAPQATVEGGSNAIAAAAALVSREVDQNRWTANDPFFMPAVILDNMPNYQQGILRAVSRFSVEMMDQIGRIRGTSQIDPDLERAAGLLRYPGNVWVWDPSVSLAPTATSESQYRAAARALLSYNDRLSAGQAVFDRRGDNLMSMLERIASDLGSASAQIDTHILEAPFWLFDTEVDDLFYANKGQLYGHYIMLRELGRDFASILSERQLDGVWQQMLDSLREGSQLEPLVVIGGSPDALILPNHLTAQGFYLLRARTQLYEVVNILLK